MCIQASSALPAEFIFLELLQDAELRGGQVSRLAEVPDLPLHKHEPLKAEEAVVLIGVPQIYMLVKLACTNQQLVATKSIQATAAITRLHKLASMAAAAAAAAGMALHDHKETALQKVETTIRC